MFLVSPNEIFLTKFFSDESFFTKFFESCQDFNQAEQKVDANDDRATVRDEICRKYQK